jgi:hypothetical protein
VTDAVCFRCDWRGRRRGRRCPSCGATLYRSSDRDAARVDAADEDVASTGHEPSRTRGSRAPLGLVALLALLAVLTFGMLPSDEPGSTDRPTGGEPLGRGRLVLAAGAGDHETLWVLDLASGGSERGPRLPSAVVELVDVSSTRPGSIGVERRTHDGRAEVIVFRGLRLGSTRERLGRGDLVAWGPAGRSVVFATNRPRAGGCSRVRIRLVAVLTQRVGWALDDPGICGPVVSISRSAAATYFTAPSGNRTGVYLTGSVGVPHLVFDEVSMVSASPPGASMFAPADTVDGEEHRRPPLETFLGWRGVGGPVTVGSGGHPLVIDRVLAWSSDGAEVALLGSVGATSGVFRLHAGSGTGVREPELVVRSPDVLDATFAVDGSLFLTRAVEILVERGGSVSRLPLPEGMRDVAGPIVWIP